MTDLIQNIKALRDRCNGPRPGACDEIRLAHALVENVEVIISALEYKAAKDDPQCDGTDGAHPAWWRGNDAGVKSVALKVLDMLNGQHPKGGMFALPELNEIRDKIDHMRAELRGAQTYSGLVEGDKFKLFDILRRAKQVLEDADAIVRPKKES